MICIIVMKTLVYCKHLNLTSLHQIIQYTNGGEPMARVLKVARETISRGTPSLRNLPKNNSWLTYIFKRLQ